MHQYLVRRNHFRHQTKLEQPSYVRRRTKETSLCLDQRHRYQKHLRDCIAVPPRRNLRMGATIGRATSLGIAATFSREIFMDSWTTWIWQDVHVCVADSSSKREDSSPGPLSYFFCVAENEATRGPYSILRSWLSQLLDQAESVLALMDSIFAKRTSKDQPLTHLKS
jgi:hypothetical protein